MLAAASQVREEILKPIQLVIILRNLLEGTNHSLRTAHRVRVSFDESFTEQIDIQAVNDNLERSSIGPIGCLPCAIRKRRPANAFSRSRR